MVRIDVPDLWIVNDALAARVAAELGGRKMPSRGGNAVASRCRRHILSGLIKCGICGANYVMGSRDYHRCASVKKRGTCGNASSVRVDRIEDLVLSTLQSDF